MIPKDMLYPLRRGQDGVCERIRTVPADGLPDSCWWTEDLTDAELAEAEVRLEDGTVRTLQVIRAFEGLFIGHKAWSLAMRDASGR